MTLAASIRPDRYEPLGANAPRTSITALHLQACADIWRESGSPAQQKFIPDLELMAANATARAAAPIDGQPDLFAGDI
ncbi:hypothetical protein [Brevundimonas sp. Root1423]|uniref:hypothetical protein n=1 Tax=Brevundimonas sp. Root1423 TaxID=1736462 RepID=UPI0012E39CFC|nr:hypothetical protein [Brevundimonas sp. Root1423]